MYNRGKNVRNKGKRTEKGSCVADTGELVLRNRRERDERYHRGQSIYTVCELQSLYDVASRKCILPHSRIIPRVFQICRVSLARLVFLGDSKRSQYVFLIIR